MCRLMLFITFGKFLAIISSNIFEPFLSFLLFSTITDMLACLMVSHRSPKLCSFFSLFFFSLQIRPFLLIDFQSHLFVYSTISNILLRLSCKFFISVIIFFNSRIFVPFKITYLYIETLYLKSNYGNTLFNMISCYLNIFIIALSTLHLLSLTSAVSTSTQIQFLIFLQTLSFNRFLNWV